MKQNQKWWPSQDNYTRNNCLKPVIIVEEYTGDFSGSMVGFWSGRWHRFDNDENYELPLMIGPQPLQASDKRFADEREQAKGSY